MLKEEKTVKQPKQFLHWLKENGLKPESGWHASYFNRNNKRHDHYYFVGHGRRWRINCNNEFEQGDTFEEFDRWALCDSVYVDIPPEGLTRKTVKYMIETLLKARAFEDLNK